MTTFHDYTNSVMREKLCLHIFLSDIYKLCWKNEKYKDIQILFPEIDSSGADIVIVHKQVSCFIQLKSINKNSSTYKFPINKELFNQSSFCVLLFTLDEETISINYRIFKKKENLDYKNAKHSKANAEGIKKERPNIIELPKTEFADIRNTELIDKIFDNENI